MHLPTWVVDEILLVASPSGVRLALALFRHGSAQVSGDGNRRAYWRGPKPRLARLAGITKRSVDAAIVELEEMGAVVVHDSARAGAGVALSAVFEREGDANFAPPFEAETGQHVVVDSYSPDPVEALGSTNMLSGGEPERGAIFASLRELGVADAGAWFERWDARDIAGAVAMARSQRGIENPGGFARAMLQRGYRAAEPEPEVSPAEARAARFLSGAWSHVIRTGAER